MGEPCNWKCARKRYCNLELLRLTISRWPAVPCALFLLVPSRFPRRLLGHETLQMSRTFVAFIQKFLGIYLSIDIWIYFTAPPPQISIKIAQTVTPPAIALDLLFYFAKFIAFLKGKLRKRVLPAAVYLNGIVAYRIVRKTRLSSHLHR